MTEADGFEAARGAPIKITRFRRGEEAQSNGLDELAREIDDDELVWVEIGGDDVSAIRQVCAKAGMSEPLTERMASDWRHPWVDADGDQFALCAFVAHHAGGLEFSGRRLIIGAGRNVVITLHPESVEFLDELREREGRRSRVGALSAESFVASLLGWHLQSYFQAAADFERSVERLEEAVLRSRGSREMEHMRNLRKGASRMRRMLAPHRAIFAAIARPDFRPDADENAQRHFKSLYAHFERAMDIVENARELVIGSFELFSNQIALQTNETMRALTFLTVVIGLQTVIAGVLGMNFDAPFFKTQAAGFWVAVGGMIAVGAAAALLGRRRKWF